MEIDQYRPCVGVVLVNAEGLVFTGERVEVPGAWQMPQGGIDDGETPENAAFRELEEETGVPKSKVTLLDETPGWITYDLPDFLVGKMWKGRYRGQKQKWFLLRFHGDEADFNLDKHHREFARWRWSTPAQVVSDIVPFKRDAYVEVMASFERHLSP